MPLAIGITLVCGIVYTVVQQVYRQSANDPQIQMAENAARALGDGRSPEDLLGAVKVDMTQSLAPYLIVFDQSGNPLVSGVELDGQIPVPPVGVFDFAKRNKQDWITWQPRPGIRHAAIIVYFNGKQTGFVLAARSMREVEDRIDKLGMGILVGWLFTLFCILIAVLLIELFTQKYTKQSVALKPFESSGI
jgi:hypothetical protein